LIKKLFMHSNNIVLDQFFMNETCMSEDDKFLYKIRYNKIR